ncbi:glycosyltransferase family 4 protein [Spiribacter roseus]|uniref:glycosyltransferase family 4 protein n=1 Tax=Spiribacter roseus TaxID=1855875 RepID=UPI00132FC42A|nr:glycosyltransferase family 4 protein [Spiribacter roseus]KAF0284633.1 hypothetical protein BA898_10045 [Spiribacter roseus]
MSEAVDSAPEIVFVSTYAFDEPVVRNRLTPFIDLALAQGLRVTVVNPEGGTYYNAAHPAFTHRTLALAQANRGGLIQRTLRETALAWRVLGAVPRNPEYMVITVPSMFLLFLGWRVSAGRRLLDLRDLTWEYLGDHSLLRRSSKHCFRFLARRAMPNFDLIAVTCQAEQKALARLPELPAERLVLASNGLARSQFEALAPVADQPEIGERGRLRVLYAGNVGLAQNLATLLEAARRLPGIDVDVVGAGSDFERIQALAADVPNVHLHGRVAWSRLPAFYQSADVLYAQLTPDYARAMPSKLYEYLATGKPLVYGGQGEAQAFLQRFEHVVTIEPDNVDELISAVDQTPQLGERIPVNEAARRFVAEKYIREDAVRLVYKRFLQT